MCKGGGIGLRTGPLTRTGLNEPLGLTVGARGIGLGAKLAQPGAATSLAPAMTAVSRAIVGHFPFDGNAVAGKPSEAHGREMSPRPPCARRTASMRPSFLTSIWISSPGCSGW